MKKLKLFLLAAAAVMAMTASADDIDGTFQFVDSNGNIIANGSTITVSTLTEDDFAGTHISSGISVLNTTASTAAVGLDLTISQIDNGSLSCCFPTNCSAQTAVVSGLDNGSDIMEASEQRDFHTNYYPTAYGLCTATFQLKVYNVSGSRVPTVGDFKAYGPAITVQFAYIDPAGISATTTDSNSSVTGYYNANGQRLTGPAPGLNIIRYADGTSRKAVMK